MSLLLYYLYPFHIDKTSNPYSYLNNIHFVFVFDNICIRIHICFKIMETDMGRALSDPFPPLIFSLDFEKKLY
jgi:hypothetical protein